MSSGAKPVGTTLVEPRTQEWLDQLAAAGGTPLYELSPQDARDVLRGAQTSVPVEVMPADVEDRVIPGGPTGEVSIRIVKPQHTTDVLPVIVHSHGGGWILGDKDTHDRLVRELANAARAAVVFVDYTPAPEAHYPVQNEQAYTALEWVAANAADFGGDPRRIALFGDSVGGNMTAALTLMAKQRSGPRIAAQVLFYPVTDADLDTGSYRQYAEGPWLTRAAMQWFWNAYLPDEKQRWEPTVSPLEASIDQLRGLPPALVVTDDDVLRDEGEAYASKLAQAGVPVTQVRYGGTIHDFALLNPIADTPAPRAAIAQAGQFLRQHLGT
ncbi:alpha/beta hydrolase [Saccharopolyspora sp. NPDC050642]|uniref:alpha/beta hydrolase n=1 Tax=Saccharopolyspora sp. NPDC050642 TaxID=3157099 RepID=UPI003402868E